MEQIETFGLKTADAFTSLLKQDLVMQGLVVLYSAIDTIAWSTCRQDDVTKADFIRWVDKYIQPARFGCTPEDLYAARCALVHSGSADSRMSRAGAASPLWYTTAPNSVPALEAEIARRRSAAKVVCTSHLAAAFLDGVLQFSEDLAADEPLRELAAARIKAWLAFVPARPLVEAWTKGEA